MLAIKNKVIEFFARLSPRERTLVGLLGFVFFLFLYLIFSLVLHQRISSLRNDIDEARKSMALIKKITPDFIAKREKKKQIESLLINNNIISLRIPVNDIAKKVSLEEGESLSGMDMEFKEAKLSDIISFEGKTQETLIEIKGKKKKDSPVFMIEQAMEFRDVPVNALYEFLDRLSRIEDLIYITKLEIIRKFNNMKNARASITVATFKMKKETLEK